MSWYALYAKICIGMNMQKYAKKKCRNMQKICKYMHLPYEFISIAYICQNMQKICKIFKHEIYMHNTHLPFCSCQEPACHCQRQHGASWRVRIFRRPNRRRRLALASAGCIRRCHHPYRGWRMLAKEVGHKQGPLPARLSRRGGRVVFGAESWPWSSVILSAYS